MNEKSYEWMRNKNKNNNCNNALVKRSIVIRLDAAHHLPQVPQQPQSQQRVATKSGTASSSSSSRRQTVDSRQQKPAVVEWVRGWGGDWLGPVYRNAILMVLTKNRKANRRRGCHCHCCCLCYPWLVRGLLLFTSRVGSAAVNSLVGSSRLSIRVYNAVHVCVCVCVSEQMGSRHNGSWKCQVVERFVWRLVYLLVVLLFLFFIQQNKTQLTIRFLL